MEPAIHIAITQYQGVIDEVRTFKSREGIEAYVQEWNREVFDTAFPSDEDLAAKEDAGTALYQHWHVEVEP